MPSDNFKDIATGDFQSEVAESTRPALVTFWAEWNGMSRELMPTLETLADAYAGRATIGRVDTDSEPELTRIYEIVRLPTTILFRGGEPVQRLPGVRTEAELRGLLDLALATDPPG